MQNRLLYISQTKQTYTISFPCPQLSLPSLFCPFSSTVTTDHIIAFFTSEIVDITDNFLTIMTFFSDLARDHNFERMFLRTSSSNTFTFITLKSSATHMYGKNVSYYINLKNRITKMTLVNIRNGHLQHRLSFDSLTKKIQNYTYNQHSKLGQGYSSQVFKGRDQRNNRKVAIKVVNLHRVREKRHEELLMRQVRLLQELHHGNIVNCYEALMTNNNCYIVMEYCGEGDLSAWIRKKGEVGGDERVRMAVQITAAISHLHQQHIIHRDIKPNNILLHRGRPKLADFGFATRCSEPVVKDGYKIGSPLYMSPQALLHRQYSKKSDVWSLGVTLYQMFQGKAPWEVSTQAQLREVIERREEVRFEVVGEGELREVIRRCLEYDRERRLTAEEALVRLQKIMGLGIPILNNKQTALQSNKQNDQNATNTLALGSQQPAPASQSLKKHLHQNYLILRWLLNYSRFCSKLLPKLQSLLALNILQLGWVQLCARCLYMSINKLKRLQQYWQSLGLLYFEEFKATSHYQKIMAVTQEYHHKYLMMLVKLQYKYSLSQNMALNVNQNLIKNIMDIEVGELGEEELKVVEAMVKLVENNVGIREKKGIMMTQVVDFELAIQKLERNEGKGKDIEEKRREVDEKRLKLLQEIDNKERRQ